MMNVICKNCKIEFNKELRYIRKSNNHFCSRRCSTTYNNTVTPKRKTDKSKFLCSCGAPKYYSSKTCQKCFSVGKSKLRRNKTIAELLGKGASRAKYNQLRTDARRVLKEAEIEKCCKKCGFSEVVEVCHVKAITTFPPTAKVSEVNHIDNLIYLCPNHHALFDLGKCTL